MTKDVSETEFDLEVLQKSHTRPILVDFWAEWCGPCRMLGPVLEKIEKERGDFDLVKIDTDKNPGISQKFKISGIPAVKLFSKGEVIGEFSGALPEAMVIKFLNDNLPDPQIDELIKSAQSDPLSAAQKAIALQKSGPKISPIYWLAALEAIKQAKNIDEIRSFLDCIPASDNEYASQALALKQYLKNEDKLDEIILKLLKADQETQKRAILDQMIQEIEKTSDAQKDKSREILLLSFQLIGVNDPLVNEYRKKLSRILY